MSIGTAPVGPLSMLAACLAPAVGAAAVDRPGVGLVSVAAEVLAVGWLAAVGRAWRGVAVRLAVAVLAAASIGGSTWLYGGQRADTAWAAVLRIGYLVLPAVILTPSIRPGPLGDHLAQRLHLPARPVVAAVAALQRLGSLAEQARQVHWARRARGLGVDGGPVRRVRHAAAAVFALLVVSMRQTGAMAVAMSARGFADATRRSWAEPAPWKPADTVLLVIAVGLAVLPWLVAVA
jgi:energy-coupling factor transporter transmembrane protein EcfT